MKHISILSKGDGPEKASLEVGGGFFVELLTLIRDALFFDDGGNISGTPLYDLLSSILGKSQ